MRFPSPLLLLQSLFFSRYILFTQSCLNFFLYISSLKTACFQIFDFLSTALKMSTNDVMFKKKKTPVPRLWIGWQLLQQELNCFCLTLCESSMMVSAPRPCPQPPLQLHLQWVYLFVCLFGDSRVVSVCPLWVSELLLPVLPLSSCPVCENLHQQKKHNLACTTNTEAAPSMMTNF